MKFTCLRLLNVGLPVLGSCVPCDGNHQVDCSMMNHVKLFEIKNTYHNMLDLIGNVKASSRRVGHDRAK